jgi:hypothetical protein
MTRMGFEPTTAIFERTEKIHALHWAATVIGYLVTLFFSCGSTAQFWALAASRKLSVSFRLLDLGPWTGDQLVARPLLTATGD